MPKMLEAVSQPPRGTDEKCTRRKLAPASEMKAFAPAFVPQCAVKAGEETACAPETSGEAFLMEMLAAMDRHMHQLRETQQGLVATVELACRRALKTQFARLVLVGSAALRVETPGSDVDVVCFTHRDSQEVGLPVSVLRRVHWSLHELVKQLADFPMFFNTELIDDARVPILRVMWGPPENAVAVDLSVDQSRPLDHVRWFQRVGAAPRPTEPAPKVAPLVTLTLRCVKWWLKQRQIPRTKEGGMPTIAWLLMAVHVCSLKETNQEAGRFCRARPMAALLASLAAFFRQYQSLDLLDGVLHFSPDGASSDFRRREQSGSWAELAVLDPTREGSESLSLVPRLPPATQLLLSYELHRAHERVKAGEVRAELEDALSPVPEGINALPSFVQAPFGALVVCGEVAPGSGIQQVEVAMIDSVTPRPGWSAPFLLRSDERSEVNLRLMDLEERTGRCRFRDGSSMTLSPARFICQAFMICEGNMWRLDAEGLLRFQAMRQIILDLLSRRKAPTAINSPALVNVTNLTDRKEGKEGKEEKDGQD